MIERKFEIVKSDGDGFREFVLTILNWLPKKVRRLVFQRFSEFKQNEYDEIVSLGANCVTAMTLRLWGLRDKSYPFDWIAKDDLFDRFSLIQNGFDNFFNFNDLTFYVRHGKYYATNQRTKYVMPHDFGKSNEGVPEDHYLDAKQKYQRRINRLYRNSENKKILMVYFEVLDESLLDRIKSGDLERNLIKVKNKLKASRLDLLVFHGSEVLGENLIKKYEVRDLNVSCFMTSYNKNSYERKEFGDLYNRLGTVIKAVCTKKLRAI